MRSVSLHARAHATAGTAIAASNPQQVVLPAAEALANYSPGDQSAAFHQRGGIVHQLDAVTEVNHSLIFMSGRRSCVYVACEREAADHPTRTTGIGFAARN